MQFLVKWVVATVWVPPHRWAALSRPPFRHDPAAPLVALANPCIWAHLHRLVLQRSHQDATFPFRQLTQDLASSLAIAPHPVRAKVRVMAMVKTRCAASRPAKVPTPIRAMEVLAVWVSMRLSWGSANGMIVFMQVPGRAQDPPSPAEWA